MALEAAASIWFRTEKATSRSSVSWPTSRPSLTAERTDELLGRRVETFGEFCRHRTHVRSVAMFALISNSGEVPMPFRHPSR
jgi:hypothetical protein